MDKNDITNVQKEFNTILSFSKMIFQIIILFTEATEHMRVENMIYECIIAVKCL